MLILYTAKVSNNEVGVSSMSQKLGLHRDLNILFSHFFLLLAPLMWSSKALSSGCEHKPLSFLFCGRNSHWRQSWFKVMGIAFCFFFFLFTFDTATQLFWNWFVIVHISISREKKNPPCKAFAQQQSCDSSFFLFHIFFTLKKKSPNVIHFPSQQSESLNDVAWKGHLRTTQVIQRKWANVSSNSVSVWQVIFRMHSREKASKDQRCHWNKLRGCCRRLL